MRVLFSSFSTVPFSVHSTFRDHDGQQLLPHGLEWGMDGDSHVTYVPSEDNRAAVDLEDRDVRQGVVEAHNRWCFAKDLPFRTVEDIVDATLVGQKHVEVVWKDGPRRIEQTVRYQRGDDLVVKDQEASRGNTSPVEVWLNGVFLSVLDGPEALSRVVDEIDCTPNAKLLVKRAEGLVRVERYFSGYLRDRSQVFDHVLDNLFALEDPQIVDDQTLIGTATLPDWIMGGTLTSRLWIRELDNGNVLFLRPLRNDDIDSSDRRFELVKGREDTRIEQVRQELIRLRTLSKMKHPFGLVSGTTSKDRLASVRKELRLNRRHRKFFGL